MLRLLRRRLLLLLTVWILQPDKNLHNDAKTIMAHHATESFSATTINMRQHRQQSRINIAERVLVNCVSPVSV